MGRTRPARRVGRVSALHWTEERERGLTQASVLSLSTPAGPGVPRQQRVVAAERESKGILHTTGPRV